MGSLGSDLGHTGPDRRTADTVLSWLGFLFWLIGVYIAFFSSTLLLTVTYVLLVGLLAAPLGRYYYTARVRDHSHPHRSRGPPTPVGRLVASVRWNVGPGTASPLGGSRHPRRRSSPQAGRQRDSPLHWVRRLWTDVDLRSPGRLGLGSNRTESPLGSSPSLGDRIRRTIDRRRVRYR